LYNIGKGTKKDLEKAIYWCDKAAKNGNKEAQYNLGQYYELGIGINQNETKAFELYEKSANQGYISAQFYLGYCYVNGIGTEVNKEKGFMLYNQAAGINDSIQFIIENEEEAVNDLDKVNYWYHKSSENVNK